MRCNVYKDKEKRNGYSYRRANPFPYKLSHLWEMKEGEAEILERFPRGSKKKAKSRDKKNKRKERGRKYFLV